MTTFAQYVDHALSTASLEPLTSTAASSFLSSLRRHGFTDISKDALRMWIVDMALADLKLSTRKKYVGRLSSLHRQWKRQPGSNPFDAVTDAVELDFTTSNPQVTANLPLLHRLITAAPSTADNATQPYTDLFLYLFYNPSLTLEEAVNLRFDHCTGSCAQTDNILDRRKAHSPRSRFVFPLQQGRKRTPQILRETLEQLSAVAQLAGMKWTGTFSRSTITSLWIAAALKAGTPLLRIKSLLTAVPAEYSSLLLVPSLPLSEAERSDTIRAVANSVNSTPRQWFVMKMRAGQTPDTIRQKIHATSPETLPHIQFYHPTHRELRKNSAGKRVSVEVPYLRGILFFHTECHRVAPLMSRIGDVAWCYRHTNTPSSPYCTISRAEMQAFQRAVGQFTPDIEMHLELCSQPLEAGTPVKINGGGLLSDREAVIESVKNINGTRTYTLRLTDYLQARWTVADIHEHYLSPLPNP